MQVDVVEFRLPRGERIERQAHCPDEFAPLWEPLLARGFYLAYELLGTGHEVLYISNDKVEADYRVLILTKEHKNTEGAIRALFSDVTVADADEWLSEQETA